MKKEWQLKFLMAKQGINLQKNNVFPIPNWSFSSLHDPKLAIPVSLLRKTVSIELIGKMHRILCEKRHPEFLCSRLFIHCSSNIEQSPFSSSLHCSLALFLAAAAASLLFYGL
jgi:hypothetical protein